MTRFTSITDGIEMVMYALKNMHGGEFVQKTKSYKIFDLANLIQGNQKFNIIGIRPGENFTKK